MTEILEKAKKWTLPPYDQDTRNEIKILIENNETNELKERFYKNLEFGTGGIRGEMGAGSNRMNIYTVGMATQGLADYLLSHTEKPKVVIAYDSRNNSEKFARHSAAILAANNISVYIFDELKPTPLMSFAVRYLKATAGINITASHNPKEYNGYKVFFNDGCQVLPPHDTGIISEVQKINSPELVKSSDFDEAIKNGKINYVPKEVEEEFLNEITKLSIRKEMIKNNPDKIKIVYTPLHGAGVKLVPAILNKIGFKNVIKVDEQCEPDGNFPTVKVPNPEEKEALEKAVKAAEKENADIVIATDPDCDRMGIAVKTKNGFELFNGNETGIVLTHYMLSSLKQKNKLPKNPYIIKTVVTSDTINAIADDFNVEVIETLTGFKYIGNLIEKNINKKSFIIGFEESYGYLTGDFIRDKCGVSSSAMIAEVMLYCKTNNMTLKDYLNSIYEKYGHRKEFLKSFTLKGIEGKEKIKSVIKKLRENPPEKIADTKVEKIRDINKLTVVKNNEVIEKLNLPKSNVLTFYLEDGTTVTARPSGTEPKIKFYLSVLGEEKNINKKAKQIIKNIEEWVK